VHKIDPKLKHLIFFLNFDLAKGGSFSPLSPTGCTLGFTPHHSYRNRIFPKIQIWIRASDPKM